MPVIREQSRKTIILGREVHFFRSGKSLSGYLPADPPLFLFQASSIDASGELTGLAHQTSTGDLHAFLATLLGSDSGSANAAAAQQAGTSERKQVVLTENVRKQLRQRLCFLLPGARLMERQ
jgi:hypothetical protein